MSINQDSKDKDKSSVLDYRSAGVNIDAGNSLVSNIAEITKATARPEVLSSLGGFGALCEIPKNYTHPVLVSATDGVGTKLKLAMDALRTPEGDSSVVNLSGGDRRRKGRKYRKSKRKKKRRRRTRKQMNKIRMKNPKSCCAGPGCPEWKHCINVLGDKSMGIRPKTENTLKIIKKCAQRYSTYKNKNYKKCLKIERKKIRKKNKKKKTKKYRVKSRK